MKRDWVNVGNTSVLAGGVVPLKAICSIVQNCFCPLATWAMTDVQSPTWLMAVLVMGGLLAEPEAVTG